MPDFVSTAAGRKFTPEKRRDPSVSKVRFSPVCLLIEHPGFRPLTGNRCRSGEAPVTCWLAESARHIWQVDRANSDIQERKHDREAIPCCRCCPAYRNCGDEKAVFRRPSAPRGKTSITETASSRWKDLTLPKSPPQGHEARNHLSSISEVRVSSHANHFRRRIHQGSARHSSGTQENPPRGFLTHDPPDFAASANCSSIRVLVAATPGTEKAAGPFFYPSQAPAVANTVADALLPEASCRCRSWRRRFTRLVHDGLPHGGS